VRADFRVFQLNHTRTPAQLRRGGFFVVAIGLLISAIAAVVLVLALGWQIPPAWMPDSIRVEPRTTPWETPVGLVVFMAATLFYGAAAVVEGLWMIVLGRVNVVLLRVMLVMIAVFFVAGFVASGMLGRRFGQIGQ
jgi:hypothetical protein